MRGRLWKTILQKSRNSCTMNGGGVKAHRQLTPSSNINSPETKYKRSNNVSCVISVAFKLGQLGHI